MEGESGADKFCTGGQECIGESTERKKEVVYDICALQDMFGTHQENTITGQLIRISHEKYIEPSRLREIVSSFEDCRDVEAGDRKWGGAERLYKRLNKRQFGIHYAVWELYKQSVLMVFRRLVS